MATTAREEKRCAYCGSRDINAGKRAGLKLMLNRLAAAWASPDEPEVVVNPKSKVSCATCKAVYTVQTIGNEKTRALLGTIGVHETAIANFTDMFTGHTLDELGRSATAAVQPDADTLHIFFVLDGKRACLGCGRVDGRFVAASVEGADR